MSLADWPERLLARPLGARRVKSDAFAVGPGVTCRTSQPGPGEPAAGFSARSPDSASQFSVLRKIGFMASGRHSPMQSAIAAHSGGTELRTIQDCGGGND